ncbi:MAG TPA: GNAT family N-acetyltransferase [Kofleriaceae bacterium]|nr:GNAT family N-acetyltransferase [Kofleriaceae bacterium]
MQLPPYRITWPTAAGQLVAIEPTLDEVAHHAPTLAAAYNDPRNAPLLGHTEAMSEDDVIAHYASVAQRGGRNFLILRDGALAGDADLRNPSGGAAEFAFLVAEVSAQGRGLGTRMAIMLHAFAFAALGLERVYASILPANVASRRVFEKLGYAVDTSPAARAFADEPGDITMRVDRAAFERTHAAQLAEIELAPRYTGTR